MNIFFTSDLHLGHTNIIKLTNAPFSTLEEREQAILTNWNQMVKPEDSVYILGDVSWYDTPTTEHFLSKLNGTKYVIRGNHDKTNFLNDLKDCGAIKDWYEYKELNINKQKYCLFHYPMQEWDGFFHNAIHLHGHIHSNSLYSKGSKVKTTTNLNRYDVGVDANNFCPVSLNFIKTIKKPLLKEENFESFQ